MKIGAGTEIELMEKKDRVEDALAATRAAIDEGIVPGGGIALRKAKSSILWLKGENDDLPEGIQVIVKACNIPFSCILENAGLNADVIWKDIKNQDITGKFDEPGFDARNEEYVCMYESGIIDAFLT